MEGYATRLVDTLRPLLVPEAVNYIDPLHEVLVQLLEDIVSRYCMYLLPVNFLSLSHSACLLEVSWRATQAPAVVPATVLGR